MTTLKALAAVWTLSGVALLIGVVIIMRVMPA
jgi:hypothetical protein